MRIIQDNELQILQNSLAQQNIVLRFSTDVFTKTLVVEMIDSQTGRAILQLPSKNSLKSTAKFAKM